jgi:hypothetical protein
MLRALLPLVLSLVMSNPVLHWVASLTGNAHGVQTKAGSQWDPDGTQTNTAGNLYPNGAQTDAGGSWDPTG